MKDSGWVDLKFNSIYYHQHFPDYASNIIKLCDQTSFKPFTVDIFLNMLKGLSHKKLQGSEVVSINRSSFKLFPEKVKT